MNELVFIWQSILATTNDEKPLELWEIILFVIICSLLALGIAIAMIVYYIKHFKNNHEVGKNKFLIINQKQELNKKSLEDILKSFAKSYKNTPYKNDDFEDAIKSKGYYTFIFGINYDHIGFNVETICQELQDKGVFCFVMKYREYQRFSKRSKGKIYQPEFGNKDTTKKSKSKK